jgi:DNA repair protein RadD
MYNLRPYQSEAVDIAIDKLRNYHKPFIVQAATGAGKSLIIADICHKLNEPVLILQPSKEILSQNYQKLQSYGVTDVSMYSASMNSKEIAKFTYATIGSIYKKPDLFKHFKYVIIDEAHGVNPRDLTTMYGTFLKAIDCKNVLGLTATPYRIQQTYFWERGNMYYTASLKMINRIANKEQGKWVTFWKDIAFKIETGDLIDQGYLCPISYYQERASWDELKVNTTGADFTTESLEKYWNTKRLRRIAQAIQYSNTHHKRTLVFCSSIRQATNAAELARALGIECAVVTSKTPKKERESVVEGFRAGKIKHLLNVSCFAVGLDVPQLDAIVLARPTMSLALYYQMIGRGVRLDPDTPDKKLHVYDLAGVVEKMGRVEHIRISTEDPTASFSPSIVLSEYGRMDGSELFKFFVKNKPFGGK